jgi:hypothetical protein
VGVYREPTYTQVDITLMQSTDPLSTIKINSNAGRLPMLALLTSVEMHAAAWKDAEAPAGEQDRNYREAAAAATLPLLHHPDPQARQAAAMVIAALADTGPGFEPYLFALTTQLDETVRAIGAATVPLTQHLIATLAADSSAEVRATLASRGTDLPDEIRQALLHDPHARVRRAAALPAEAEV